MSSKKFSYLLSFLLVFAFISNQNYSVAAPQNKAKTAAKNVAKNKTDKTVKSAKSAKSAKTAKNRKDTKTTKNAKNTKTTKNIVIKSRKANVAKVNKMPFEQYAADGSLNFRSDSVLVLNQNNGKVVMEKNSRKVVPIASISKLMTAMVVLDAKLPMNGVVSID